MGMTAAFVFPEGSLNGIVTRCLVFVLHMALASACMSTLQALDLALPYQLP